ncbi:helix-turn-helix domain-containing protein [Kordia zhangzhouensis]|uniref:helix-turn-helix domain-containing protein n=1 Tax=Kordia zhangzhouensis TaxID=1620405 RepID=UPI0006293CD2|nr:helix-turn-helix domain-containing protein [Kordia zhangzhouensis]
MLLQKYVVCLLLIFIISSNQHLYANTIVQNHIASFDQEAFKKSLSDIEPKEFARLFTQQYKLDSIKTKISVDYAESVMLSSKELRTQFWGNFVLAHWYHSQMRLEESLNYVDRLYVIAKKMNENDLILSALINKGNFYYAFGSYKESMEYNLEALELARKTKNLKRELAISLNIALIKQQTNDNSGAIEILEKIIATIETGTAGDLTPFKTKVYVALIKGYIYTEDYTKAKQYCEQGIVLSNQNNLTESKFYFLSFLGTIEGLNKNYDRAHELLDASLEIAHQIKSIDPEIPLIYFEKGEVYYYEGKYEKAVEYLVKSEKLMNANHLNFIKLEETYALLAKSYNELGDINNSIKYFEKANDIYKQNDKRQENISINIIRKYDLQSLKEELSLAEENSYITKIILFVSVFLAIITVIWLVYFYKQREKENQRKFAAILQSLEDEKEEIVEKIAQVTQEKLEEKTTEKLPEKKIEAKEVEIIDETKVRLLKKLEKFETKEQYLSRNCSLNEVAKKLKTNTSYLSKLVNSHKGKSFSAYITDLRINYAIRRLKDDKKFRSYTIDSIAQEIGFNRSESFSRAFKNKTGLYPSYYIKNLDNKGIE